MPTNDEIKHRVKQNLEEDYFKAVEAVAKMYTDSEVNKILNEARSDTTSKHIGAIWNWWATKPQKSQNDATTRIITRADIEELVRMME